MEKSWKSNADVSISSSSSRPELCKSSSPRLGKADDGAELGCVAEPAAVSLPESLAVDDPAGLFRLFCTLPAMEML